MMRAREACQFGLVANRSATMARYHRAEGGTGMTRWGCCGFGVLLTALAVVLVSVPGQGQSSCTWGYPNGLVLTGDQSLVITEGTLCVHGRITLSGNARLVITDAALRMTDFVVTVWESWAHIDVRDRAQLVMRNTRVEAPGSGTGGVWIHAYDASRTEIARVSLAGEAGLWIDTAGSAIATVNESTLREVRVRDRVDVKFVRSRVDWTVDLQFTGSSSADLSNLRGGSYSGWEIPDGLSAGFRLSLQETYVGGWSVEVSDWARVAVRDSVLNRIMLRPAQVPSEVSGMRPGQYSNWSIQDAMGVGTTGALTLTNTSVEGWVLNLHNARTSLTLRNSHLTGLYIRDSSMRVRLESVVVNGLIMGNSFLVLECNPMTVMRGLELHSTRLDIGGDVRFQYTASKVVWNTSTVVREYEVRVRGNAGQPARNLQVGLEDPSGNVTNYTSDQDGVLRFTIRFDDTNYDKTWNLVTQRGTTTVKVPIGLLTSTPLQTTAW